MNNQQKKLFNIVCATEKILFDRGAVKFHKTCGYNYIKMHFEETVQFDYIFLEAFTDLTKKENVVFNIYVVNNCLELKIYF